MNIVFLDIDGVLNHEGCWSQFGGPAPEGCKMQMPIAPECMERLNRLLEETGAYVVVSSSWRRHRRWQDIAETMHVGYGFRFPERVIGDTPDLVNDVMWLEAWRQREGAPMHYERIERGMEIHEWIRRQNTGDYAHEFAGGSYCCTHCDEEIIYDADIICHGREVTEFCILDDCSDMWELRPYLVHTDPEYGLQDEDVERAKFLMYVSRDKVASIV